MGSFRNEEEEHGRYDAPDVLNVVADENGGDFKNAHSDDDEPQTPSKRKKSKDKAKKKKKKKKAKRKEKSAEPPVEDSDWDQEDGKNVDEGERRTSRGYDYKIDNENMPVVTAAKDYDSDDSLDRMVEQRTRYPRYTTIDDDDYNSNLNGEEDRYTAGGSKWDDASQDDSAPAQWRSWDEEENDALLDNMPMPKEIESPQKKSTPRKKTPVASRSSYTAPVEEADDPTSLMPENTSQAQTQTATMVETIPSDTSSLTDPLVGHKKKPSQPHIYRATAQDFSRKAINEPTSPPQYVRTTSKSLVSQKSARSWAEEEWSGSRGDSVEVTESQRRQAAQNHFMMSLSPVVIGGPVNSRDKKNDIKPKRRFFGSRPEKSNASKVQQDTKKGNESRKNMPASPDSQGLKQASTRESAETSKNQAESKTISTEEKKAIGQPDEKPKARRFLWGSAKKDLMTASSASKTGLKNVEGLQVLSPMPIPNQRQMTGSQSSKDEIDQASQNKESQNGDGKEQVKTETVKTSDATMTEDLSTLVSLEKEGLTKDVKSEALIAATQENEAAKETSREPEAKAGEDMAPKEGADAVTHDETPKEKDEDGAKASSVSQNKAEGAASVKSSSSVKSKSKASVKSSASAKNKVEASVKSSASVKSRGATSVKTVPVKGMSKASVKDGAASVKSAPAKSTPVKSSPSMKNVGGALVNSFASMANDGVASVKSAFVKSSPLVAKDGGGSSVKSAPLHGSPSMKTRKGTGGPSTTSTPLILKNDMATVKSALAKSTIAQSAPSVNNDGRASVKSKSAKSSASMNNDAGASVKSGSMKSTLASVKSASMKSTQDKSRASVKNNDWASVKSQKSISHSVAEVAIYTKSLASNLESVPSAQKSTSRQSLGNSAEKQTDGSKFSDESSAFVPGSEHERSSVAKSGDLNQTEPPPEESLEESMRTPQEEVTYSPRTERHLETPKGSQHLVELDEFAVPVEVQDDSMLVQCLEYYNFKSAAKIAGIVISATDCRSDKATHESFEVQMLGQKKKDEVENQRLREHYSRSQAVNSTRLDTEQVDVSEHGASASNVEESAVESGNANRSLRSSAGRSGRTKMSKRQPYSKPVLVVEEVDEDEDDNDDSTQSAPEITHTRSRVREVTSMRLHLEEDHEAKYREKRRQKEATERAKRKAAPTIMPVASIEIPANKTEVSEGTCDSSSASSSTASSADVEIAPPESESEAAEQESEVAEQESESAAAVEEEEEEEGEDQDGSSPDSAPESIAESKTSDDQPKPKKRGLLKRLSARMSRGSSTAAAPPVPPPSTAPSKPGADAEQEERVVGESRKSARFRRPSLGRSSSTKAKQASKKPVPAAPASLPKTSRFRRRPSVKTGD